VNWLKYGDRNTKFFHQYAKQRGKVNKIKGILGEDNRWRTCQEDIGCVLVNYFRGLFFSGGGTMVESIFEAVDRRVSLDHYNALSRPFSREEIEVGLKGMGPTKAPGPDGMSPIFYQKVWLIVGTSVVTECLMVLNGQSSVRGLNQTLIALIPKVQD
jgi:hypothetical protein